MELINFILNVTGLLLWLSWRSIRLDPFGRAKPATLAGTVRPAEPHPLKRWHLLVALAALLFLRAVFYCRIEPGADWTPRLDLGVVVLVFQGGFLAPALLFSVLSFLRCWVIFYSWLITLTVINGRVGPPDPFQKMIWLQLGRAARWPRLLLAILPVLAAAGLWLAIHPLLTYVGVISPAQSSVHLAAQGLLIGLALCLTLKYLLPVFLVLHLVSSYVYLGTHPLWDFIGRTARHILSPLRGLPLRLSKMDFAPLVGIVLILLLLHTLPDAFLSQLNRNNLTLWPQ